MCSALRSQTPAMQLLLTTGEAATLVAKQLLMFKFDPSSLTRAASYHLVKPHTCDHPSHSCASARSKLKLDVQALRSQNSKTQVDMFVDCWMEHSALCLSTKTRHHLLLHVLRQTETDSMTPLTLLICWRRPVGRIYATYMATSGDLGLITQEHNTTFICVFSEPITGLSPEDFAVTGPSGVKALNLQPVPQTTTYYSFGIDVGAYYGNVTVSFVVSPFISACLQIDC